MPETTPPIAKLRALRKQMRVQRPVRAVRVCATGCRALGALEVHEAFEKELAAVGLAHQVALVKTGCQGVCAGAPVIGIDPEGILYLGAKPEDVPEIVRTTLVEGGIVDRLCFQGPHGPVPRRADVPFFAAQKQIVLDRCGRIDPTRIESALAEGAYEMLERALSAMSPEQVIEEITASGLRGRGGAGFPTGRKWAATRAAAGDPKYLVCNADEGDPGAFMDRAVVEGDPHAVLEGMLLAAYAIGASEGYIYVRAEYPIAIEHLRIAITQAREYGLLGADILGTGMRFDVKIQAGAGAFVCGEETALLASLEGKRGMPRPRPPFPSQSGVWGRPTAINNVETLAGIPAILRMGGAAYARLGTETSKGTKIFALAGKVRYTGLVEVPIGITVGELVNGIGGGTPNGASFKAVQMGGPSGGCVPARCLDMPIDYETVKEVGAIMGSGGLIVLDDTTCMVDLARYFMAFCASESCGKCPPCRIGTRRMLDILDRICAGRGRPGDVDRLEALAAEVKANALCGLGQTAPNPVLTTLRHFRAEYDAHVGDRRCPAGACRELITYTIVPETCICCGRCAKSCPADCIAGRIGKPPARATELEREKGQAGRPFAIRTALCIKCGACQDVCPVGAVIRE